jgi:putative Mn2+ efflux pump MntP
MRFRKVVLAPVAVSLAAIVVGAGFDVAGDHKTGDRIAGTGTISLLVEAGGFTAYDALSLRREKRSSQELQG